MSYCRFSCEDFQCDVYVYADVSGGYTTHVAGNRYVFKVPLPPYVPFDRGHLDEWVRRHAVVMKMIDECERVPIDRPAGVQDYYNHDTAAECAENLEWLRSKGYRVPQYAIDGLRDELGAE